MGLQNLMTFVPKYNIKKKYRVSTVFILTLQKILILHLLRQVLEMKAGGTRKDSENPSGIDLGDKIFSSAVESLLSRGDEADSDAETGQRTEMDSGQEQVLVP